MLVIISYNYAMVIIGVIRKQNKYKTKKKTNNIIEKITMI